MARDGLKFFLFGLTVFFAGGILFHFTQNRALLILCIVGLLGSVFCVYFFRDPERHPDQDENLNESTILSAADGRVMEIAEDHEDDFIQGKVTRISIFLSLFDVHINRIPISGVVEYLNYQKGAFHAAFLEKASLKNEQSAIGIKSTKGKILFRQIAGFVARRIIYNLSTGDYVTAGERFGIIRFGSRVDMMLPPNCLIHVKKGDRVRGGETIIGELYDT